MGKTYTGVSNIAKQISKIYAGVGGVAKQISKVYAGDANGIARLVYQNGTYLIKNGVSVNEDISGGWQGRRTLLDLSGNTYMPSITSYTNYIQLAIQRDLSNARTGIFEIINDIDLSPYKKIVLDSKINSGTTGNRLCVIDRDTDTIIDDSILPGSRRKKEIDISEINDFYDICICVHASTSKKAEIILYNLWLE